MRISLRNLSAAERKKAELSIRKVFEDGCTAWNQGDLDGYLAGYWDSDEIVWISGGSLTGGKKAIVAAYKARFSTPRQMGRLTLDELQIDVLTITDAIAFGRWTLAADNKVAKGFFTVQLKKIDGTWLFVYDHSSAGE